MNGNCGECERRYHCEIDPAECDNLTEPVLTNADEIRAMTDEELAYLLLDGCRGSRCDDNQPTESGWIDCLQCRLNWLRQPVKEDN